MKEYEEIVVTAEELQQRALEGTPYADKHWVVEDLPPGRKPDEQEIRLFGRRYLWRRYQLFDTIHIWYLPLEEDVNVCIHFCHSHPGEVRKHLREMSALTDSRNLPPEIEPGEAEAFWIYLRAEDDQPERFAGPRSPAVTKDDLQSVITIGEMPGKPTQVRLVWKSQIRRASEQAQPVNQPVTEGPTWTETPPGRIARLIMGMNPITQEEVDRAERLKLLFGLKPRKWWRQVEGKRICVVAEFDTCFVAESPMYRNAAYVLLKAELADPEAWREILALRLRRDLQARGGIQVIHQEGCDDQITAYVRTGQPRQRVQARPKKTE